MSELILSNHSDHGDTQADRRVLRARCG